MNHSITNKKVTPRLFSNNLMEKLSHVHPSVPVIIYLPVIIYFLLEALHNSPLTFGAVLALFGAGILIWTLTEYLIHRYIFHFEPASEIGQRLHFLAHGVHHAYPRDPMRLVMPPVLSIPLAILVFALVRSLAGPALGAPLFAGIIFGYLVYDMIHFATHHLSHRRSRPWLLLKQHHLRHHYQNEHYAFGVSSPLWDFLFGTLPPNTPGFKKARQRDTQET